jgi:hypothetical protein
MKKSWTEIGRFGWRLIRDCGSGHAGVGANDYESVAGDEYDCESGCVSKWEC